MLTTLPSSSCPTKLWCVFFAVFHRYELASGAKLNVTKSHGLLVGSWASRTNLPVALNWSAEAITVMGSRLSNTVTEDTWKAPVEQFDSVLSSWASCQLSFHGCVLIANTLGLSLFWYLCSFFVMPDTVVQAVNSSLFSYLWKEKWELLHRSSITQLPRRSGLGVVDLQHKIHALHVV